MCLCPICSILDKWFEHNSLDIVAECFHILNTGIDGIISYFSHAKEVENKCVHEIKKRWSRHQRERELATLTSQGRECINSNPNMVDGVPHVVLSNKIWFHKQCFYKKWVKFVSKIQTEKKTINEDLKYLT